MTGRRRIVGVSTRDSLMVELLWYARLRWVAGAVILGVGALSLEGLTAWARSWLVFVVLGVVVLAYNLVLWFVLRGLGAREDRDRFIPLVAATGVLLDLAGLTCLTLTTGGLHSPVVGLFVLHMVFVSLLMPLGTSYLAAIVGITMLGVGLGASGAFPTTPADVLFACGWAASLLLVAYMTDHIARTIRAQESDLFRERNRSMAIFRTASDGIITITPTGFISSANEAAERIFGRSSEEMVGCALSSLLQPAGAPEPTPDLVRAGLTGPPLQMRALRSDGESIPVEVAFSEVTLPGDTLYTGVVRDITRRKRTEAELGQLNEQLRRQQNALIQHEKMTALGQMTAGVVHEIANPLSNMDSVLQLAARRPEALTPEAAKSLRTQITRINGILQQMTNFAHPDQTSSASVPVDAAVENAIELVRFDARFKRTELVREMGCGSEKAVLNPNAFQQVMVNLFTNALDALKDVSSPRVVVRTFLDGSRCCVQVSDNGCGIPADGVARVFDPFFTTKPVGQGTGLGLSISYRLVEQMGGTIRVESREGEGTTFSVELPIAEVGSSVRDFPGDRVLDSETERE